MKKIFIITLFAITSFCTQAKASCVAQMIESHIQVYESGVLTQSESGYFTDFSDEFKKKGYKVCLGKKCKGLKIDVQFQVSFASMLEKTNLPFGWGNGDYYSALVILLNNKKSTSSYSSSNFEDAFEEAKERLSDKISKCNH